jgi:hypothetical protein
MSSTTRPGAAAPHVSDQQLNVSAYVSAKPAREELGRLLGRGRSSRAILYPDPAPAIRQSTCGTNSAFAAITISSCCRARVSIPLLRFRSCASTIMESARWSPPSGACYLSGGSRPTRCPGVPHFSASDFNARSEDVDTKPSYREAFKRRRCLMPAGEFFEKGDYFRFADDRPFAFAGLWESWNCGDVIPG